MKFPSLSRQKRKSMKETDEPNRVLIGTSPGSRQDAESLARTHIERYFDMIDRSWIYTHEEPDVGFHYEIHEGGSGKPLLPSLLEIDRSDGQGVVIKAENRHAIEVLTRPDHTLHSLVLPESQSEGMITDARLRPAKKLMRPYASTGREWVKAGIAMLSIGLLTLSIAGVIHKSYSIAMDGYSEIAEHLPTNRLLQLSGHWKAPEAGMTAVSDLPVSQWERLISQPLEPGENIAKMTLEEGEWAFEVAHPPSPESSASIISTTDSTSASDMQMDTSMEDSSSTGSLAGSDATASERSSSSMSAPASTEGPGKASSRSAPPVQHEMSDVGGGA